MAQESKTPAPFRTSIGGQALIEGILMRGVDRQAIVCRKSDGTLVSRVDPLKLSKDRHPWMGYPFIRGVVNFLDSMVNGVKAITWSAEQQPEDEQGEPDKFDLWIQKHFSDETAEKIILYTAVVLGIALGMTGYAKIWPLFGAANQLLAGLGLLAVAAWLGKMGRNNKMFIFPMIFMILVTLTSLVFTIKAQIVGIMAGGQGVAWFYIRGILAVLLVILAIDLVIEGSKAIASHSKKAEQA